MVNAPWSLVPWSPSELTSASSDTFYHFWCKGQSCCFIVVRSTALSPCQSLSSAPPFLPRAENSDLVVILIPASSGWLRVLNGQNLTLLVLCSQDRFVPFRETKVVFLCPPPVLSLLHCSAKDATQGLVQAREATWAILHSVPCFDRASSCSPGWLQTLMLKKLALE